MYRDKVLTIPGLIMLLRMQCAIFPHTSSFSQWANLCAVEDAVCNPPPHFWFLTMGQPMCQSASIMFCLSQHSRPGGHLVCTMESDDRTTTGKVQSQDWLLFQVELVYAISKPGGQCLVITHACMCSPLQRRKLKEPSAAFLCLSYRNLFKFLLL